MGNAPSADRQLAVLMLAAFVLLFVPALFSRGPWHVDDLRYVEAARQMGEYGDFVVPRLNGDVYGEKPPGFSWAIIVTQFATQTSYLTAGRLVAMFAALGSGLLLVHLGGLVFGSRQVGWIGAGFLWTFIFIIDRGSRSLIDSFLYFWTTLAVVTALRAALAINVRQRIGWIAATCAAMGYGCLVKGPVALLIPIMGAISLGLIWRGRKGVCFTALLLGALAGGGLTLLWLWQASLVAGPEYLDHLLFDQIRGRIADSDDGGVATNTHAKPAWFFLLEIPPLALPWLVFLPGSARAAWRMRFSPQGRAVLGVLAWALAIFLFFSLVAGKRTGYVLPMFPPMALGIAWGVWRMQEVRDRAWLGLPANLIAFVAVTGGGLVLLAGMLLVFSPHLAKELPVDVQEVMANMDGVRRGVLIGAGVVALAWGSMMLNALRRSHLAALILAVPFIGIINATTNLTLVPAMDPALSAASFGEAVNLEWDRNERLVELNNQKDGIVTYYCNVQRVEVMAGKDDTQTAQFVANSHGPLWVVARRKDWNRLPPDLRAQFDEHAASWFNGREYVLVHRP